jgi:hypothetical protein
MPVTDTEYLHPCNTCLYHAGSGHHCGKGLNTRLSCVGYPREACSGHVLRTPLSKYAWDTPSYPANPSVYISYTPYAPSDYLSRSRLEVTNLTEEYPYAIVDRSLLVGLDIFLNTPMGTVDILYVLSTFCLIDNLLYASGCCTHIAIEWGIHKVKVNVIEPGYTNLLWWIFYAEAPEVLRPMHLLVASFISYWSNEYIISTLRPSLFLQENGQLIANFINVLDLGQELKGEPIGVWVRKVQDHALGDRIPRPVVDHFLSACKHLHTR